MGTLRQTPRRRETRETRETRESRESRETLGSARAGLTGRDALYTSGGPVVPSGPVAVLLPASALVDLPGGLGLLGAVPGARVLEGAVAEMLLAVLTHESEVRTYPKGAMELHWGPNGVQGNVRGLWQETVSATLLEQYRLPWGESSAPSPTPTPTRRRRTAPRRSSRSLEEDWTDGAGRTGVVIRGTEVPAWHV